LSLYPYADTTRWRQVFSFGSSFISAVGSTGDLDNVVVSLRYASGLLASVDVNRSSA
jgi:hypothetical protein